MLRLRLLTAAILIPLVVWAVLGMPLPWLATGLAAVALGGAWEWSRLAGCRQPATRIAHGLVLLVLLAAGWSLLPLGERLQPLLLASLALWLFAFFLVWRYQVDRGLVLPVGVWLLVGLALLAAAWLALLLLYQRPVQGPWLLLYLLVLIWTADSGAYFAGRRFGHTKLAVRVSPGKTREGVAGGLILVLLLALSAGAVLFGFRGLRLTFFVSLSLATALVSVLGDLFESLVKRQSGYKDSSRLLPGHGGVLDRIDSLMAAAPLFALGMMWLEAMP